MVEVRTSRSYASNDVPPVRSARARCRAAMPPMTIACAYPLAGRAIDPGSLSDEDDSRPARATESGTNGRVLNGRSFTFAMSMPRRASARASDALHLPAGLDVRVVDATAHMRARRR